jgi:hypothetical protein
LCAFCLVRSIGVWIECVGFDEIHRFLDCMCCTALWMFSATLVTFQLYIFIGRGKRRKPWISPNKTHSIQTPADLTKQNALNPITCGSHQTKHTQSKHLRI